MKRFAVIALAAFLAAPAFAAPPSTLFADANAKYKAGDYAGAEKLYQKIIQAGNGTGAVYYNLGNASLRLGQKGQALLSYRRAQKVLPRDKDLQWNVRVLQGALQDRIEETSLNLPLLLLRSVTGRFTADEIASVLTGLLALLALLAFLDYLSASFAAVSGFLRPLALTALFVCAALFSFQWWDDRDPRAIVLDKEVTAHFGPSDGEAKAFTLHEGAEGRVIDTSGDWIYVSLKNKNTGWIRKNSSEIV